MTLFLDLQRIRGLEPATDQVTKLESPRTERCLIEAVVSNTCPVLGQTIRESQFRTRYNAVVVAAARNGDRLTNKIGDIRLRSGDTLLLETADSFIRDRRISRDFYLISTVPNSEPMRYERSRWALILTVLMVLLAAVGWLDDASGRLRWLSVGMVVFGCCSPSQAIRGIDWSVLLVIAAALAPWSGIGGEWGAAVAIANGFIRLAGEQSPLGASRCLRDHNHFDWKLSPTMPPPPLFFQIALAIRQSA